MLYKKNEECKVIIGDHVVNGIVTKSKKPHKIEITAEHNGSHFEFVTWDNNSIHSVTGEVVGGMPSFRPEYRDEVLMLRHFFSVEPKTVEHGLFPDREKVTVYYNGGTVRGRTRKHKNNVGGVAVRIMQGPLKGKTIICDLDKEKNLWAGGYDGEMLASFYGGECFNPSLFTCARDKEKTLKITTAAKRPTEREGVDKSYGAYDGLMETMQEQERQRRELHDYAIPKLIELDGRIMLNEKAQTADDLLQRIRANVHRLMNLDSRETKESIDLRLQQIENDRNELNDMF